MLFSLALMVLLALILNGILHKLCLPGLVGMLLTGIILGPYALDLIAPELLTISADLRQLALIVILTRAGLSLDVADLKRVGRPAMLMCFVPATFEIIACTLFAPMLFPITRLESAIMGAVLGAVSPAVVVPRMLKLKEDGWGIKMSIPQMIMAGASADDVYVIVLFASFMGMYDGGQFEAAGLLSIPLSITLGIGLGVMTGIALTALFKHVHIRDTVKILIILSVSFLLVWMENTVKPSLPISGLLAVMALGATVLRNHSILAVRLSGKFSKIWVAAEILLFVLVGASVDIRYATQAVLPALALIFSALSIRMIGVFVCMTKTSIPFKERLFCAIAYLPKATVQAAIGGLPLAAGIAAGDTILTVAVLAILITAPLGAIGIDLSYQRLLDQDDGER